MNKIQTHEIKKPPKMMTIRQVAATGILPEYAIRTGVKTGSIPAFYCGSKALINYDRLVQILEGE